MTLNEKAKTVTIGGGVKYSQLAPWLDAKATRCTISLPCPALLLQARAPPAPTAPACKTATSPPPSPLSKSSPPTAIFFRSRATKTASSSSAPSSRSVRRCRHAPHAQRAAHLQVAQSVYQDLSFDELGAHFAEIFSSGYSVSVFTDWEHHRATQLWIKRRLAADDANPWPAEMFRRKARYRKTPPARRPSH